jgi:putative membrane protein
MTRGQWAVVGAILATVIGLAVTLALIASVGFDAVFGILGRIGLVRFVVYASWTLVILTVLGLGWQLLTPGESRFTYIWARTMREAATDVLPFSQFGGIVVALRVLIARGVAQPVAYASIIADQTAELVAQLVYTLFGLVALALVLGNVPGGTPLFGLALTGFGASVAVILLFAFAQAPMLAFAGRIGGTLLPGSAAAMEDVRTRLAAIYQQRTRLIGCFLLHLLAWVASGAGAVIALRAIGQPVPLENVIIIESLIFTLRTAAFLIPGGIGVQEGAYVLIGPLFGLPAEAALALSLAKRARDLAVGIPAMVIWQIGEARAVIKG